MTLAGDALKSSGFGLFFGLIAHTITYPIEVVKLNQQDPLCNLSGVQVARRLVQEKGIQAFYTGLSLRLAETAPKQLVRWPLIMQLPPLLERRGCNKNQQQALTGLMIATLETFLSTPFDALKLAAVYGLQRRVSWQGFPTYFSKRIVEWTTFLVAQNHFSNRQQRNEKRLDLVQLLTVGLQTTACVSFVRAPFDVFNTLKQTGKSLPLKSIPPLELLRRLYRGAPLSFSALLIYNFGSTILIDRLKHNSS